MVIQNISELNALLAEKKYCANGKNFRVESLYRTVAASQWPLENIHGIYLTNPEYAWMALWMAVTSREHLRKRQLRYIRPLASSGDAIGRTEIHDPAGRAPAELLGQCAHLYLFRSDRFADVDFLDLSAKQDKIAVLEQHGFSWRLIPRPAGAREGYGYDYANRFVIAIDAWQLALVNYETLVPDEEVVLERELILALSDRVSLAAEPIGKDYLL